MSYIKKEALQCEKVASNFYFCILACPLWSIATMFHRKSNFPHRQEELTVKKGDALGFYGVLGFAIVSFYCIQQVGRGEQLSCSLLVSGLADESPHPKHTKQKHTRTIQEESVAFSMATSETMNRINDMV